MIYMIGRKLLPPFGDCGYRVENNSACCIREEYESVNPAAMLLSESAMIIHKDSYDNPTPILANLQTYCVLRSETSSDLNGFQKVWFLNSRKCIEWKGFDSGAVCHANGTLLLYKDANCVTKPEIVQLNNQEEVLFETSIFGKVRGQMIQLRNGTAQSTWTTFLPNSNH